MKLTSLITSRIASVWNQVSRPAAPSKSARRRKDVRAASTAAAEVLEARDVPSGMAVGMNLDWITDYQPAWIFKDAFLQSRAWMVQDFNTVTGQQSQGTRPAQLDSNGWPTRLEQWTNDAGQLVQQRLQAVMFLSTNGAHPTGIYHAQWRGTGRVTFLGDGVVTSQGTLADGTRFAELTVTTPTNAGLHVRIDSMESADPIRDVHVWMPDYNGESFVGQVWRPGSNFSPFHPLFLERLRPFERIRFMQPSDTVTSDIVTWGDRRPVTYARQSTFATDFQNGMSPELIIELANELHVNPWINLPHMANDDYVRNLATLVRDTLDPELTATIEWSNEVWNWAPGFESHYWARAQAEAEGIRIEEFVARETLRDFDLWSQVFVGQEQRIVRTIGGFAAAPGQYGWNAQIMSRMQGRFDALAIAPYIAPTQATRATYTTTTTVDQVIADTRATIAPMANMVRQSADLLRQYEATLGRNLQLVAYEGGTHLDANNGAPYQRAFFEANGDSRLYDVVSDYLVAMEDAGLDSFDYYKFTDRRVPSLLNNDFGTLNRMDQPLATAHRYRALLDYIDTTDDGDDDLPSPNPVVTLTTTDTNAAEAGLDAGLLTVSRLGSTTDNLTVRYSVSGTATSGSDFVALSGVVTIPAGQDAATISITPLDDAAIESNETIIVTLIDDTAYDLGATVLGTVVLTSDDVARPRVTMATTDANAAEANRDAGVFTVMRSGSTSSSLTVRYTVTGTATNGLDFNTLTGSVEIPTGQASTTITVTPIDDAAVEPNETIIVTLTPNAAYDPGTPTEGTVTLTSNDTAPLPEVMIQATDNRAAEQGRDAAVFTVKRRGGNVTQALTVRYSISGTATNGSDYGSLSGSIMIPANQQMATITLVPVDDTAVESSETVILTLNTSSAYAIVATSRSATATIVDNDRLTSARASRTAASLSAADAMRYELEIAGLNAIALAQRALV